MNRFKSLVFKEDIVLCFYFYDGNTLDHDSIVSGLCKHGQRPAWLCRANTLTMKVEKENFLFHRKGSKVPRGDAAPQGHSGQPVAAVGAQRVSPEPPSRAVTSHTQPSQLDHQITFSPGSCPVRATWLMNFQKFILKVHPQRIKLSG